MLPKTRPPVGRCGRCLLTTSPPPRRRRAASCPPGTRPSDYVGTSLAPCRKPRRCERLAGDDPLKGSLGLEFNSDGVVAGWESGASTYILEHANGTWRLIDLDQPEYIVDRTMIFMRMLCRPQARTLAYASAVEDIAMAIGIATPATAPARTDSAVNAVLDLVERSPLTLPAAAQYARISKLRQGGRGGEWDADAELYSLRKMALALDE